MPRTVRRTLRIHEDLYTKLTGVAQANGWSMARLLSECADLTDITQTCSRIEVIFGNRTEGPAVRIWISGKETA